VGIWVLVFWFPFCGTLSWPGGTPFANRLPPLRVRLNKSEDVVKARPLRIGAEKHRFVSREVIRSANGAFGLIQSAVTSEVLTSKEVSYIGRRKAKAPARMPAVREAEAKAGGIPPLRSG